jgi:phosphonopyruvate decarboxylase
MLEPEWFYQELQGKGVSFFTGVPDSLLKDFCLYISNTVSPQQHIIASNEGNAIALATGYHLATGGFGLVYMQNSGLGNAINPLTSLTNPAVYGIPILLLIGWRGEPGVLDEPQHVKQGSITTNLLEVLDIPYEILPNDRNSARVVLNKFIKILEEEKRPCALVVRKGSFKKYINEAATPESDFPISREHAIQEIAGSLQRRDIIISTTGMISRELFEFRVATNCLESGQDFFTVGSMGHASQIALGIALQKPNRNVYCLDGDGAFLMHTGGTAIIGTQSPTNFKHIILNNGAHDSVGGQPTAALAIDIPGIALACKYKTVRQITSRSELIKAIVWLKKADGPALLEIHVSKGARPDLGRPTLTPQDNKSNFMKHCAK